MDKFEYKVRADEILELIGKGEYEEAAEIADSIDWRRVKSVTMLCTISDLYKINKRYEDAKNILMLAYERRPGGRTICYALCELCIKTDEYGQAVNYYNEFLEVAPNDSGRHILHYKLMEAQDVSLEERIEILEELKREDYREKWAYELAYLYHRIGQASRCVEECNQLIIWFGEGKYVYKAMELKMLHEALDPDQQAKYDNRLRQIREEAERQAAAEQAEAEAQALTEGQTVVYPEIQHTDAAGISSGETASTEEPEIQVKTVDVGKYNTINLQAELAAGLQEILRTDAITGAILEPMLQGDDVREEVSTSAPVAAGAGQVAGTQEQIAETEVFFGETGDISQAQGILGGDTGDFTEITMESLGGVETGVYEDRTDAVSGVVADTDKKVAVSVEGTQESTEPVKVANVAEAAASIETAAETAEVVETTTQETIEDETAKAVMEQMRLENAGMIASALATQPPKALAEVLSQDSDGQLRLVIPEREAVEKQITGQLNIDDILAEWERMKQESEEKRKEEVRRHVQEQTGTMFTEFEASIRDGLLEKLEKGEQVDLDTLTVVSTSEAAVTSETVTVSESAVTSETVKVSESVSTSETVTVSESVSASETATKSEISETKVVPETTETDAAVTVPETTGVASGITSEDEVEEIAEIIEEFEGDGVSETIETPVYVQEPVVERPKVRPLTREERELYAPFIQTRSAKERLVTAIDNISMAAYTGNLVVTGEEGMDTINLAVNIVREIQMTDSNFSGKVAKVSGEGLNQRNVANTIAQLNNGALIIEKAAGMSEETVGDLYKALQQENFGIVVVLEDTKRAINNLFAYYPRLESSFTARMDVEPLSNDSLVAFGRGYAREMEFAIDELGVLALHTRIEEMQTSNHVVTVLDVKRIMDDAMHHASRKTLRHFLDILFAKRYDDEDMIILTEKDFV